MADIVGKRILVVEDDELVAMMVEGMLADIGCEVCGFARSVPEALEIVETLPMDIALLDVNLAGQRVFPVAEALSLKNIPFIFSSGYGAAGVPEEYRSAPVIPKPFRLEELEAAVRQATTVTQ